MNQFTMFTCHFHKYIIIIIFIIQKRYPFLPPLFFQRSIRRLRNATRRINTAFFVTKKQITPHRIWYNRVDKKNLKMTNLRFFLYWKPILILMSLFRFLSEIISMHQRVEPANTLYKLSCGL